MSSQGCGYSGYAGVGGDGAKIRKYTASECSALGGNPGGNDECLKPGGGSFSWDCRDVNNDPVAMVYQYRYYLVGAAVVGGVLYYRSMRR